MSDTQSIKGPILQKLTSGLYLRTVATLCLLVASLVLLGWVFDIPTIKTVFPGMTPMKVNSAVMFLLIGVAVFLFLRSRENRKAQYGFIAASGLVTVIGGLNFADYFLNLPFDIEVFFFQFLPNSANVPAPTPMTSLGSASFVLIGFSLLMAATKKMAAFSQIVSLPVMLLGLLTVVEYLYGSQQLIEMGYYVLMSLHTATLFALVGMAVFLLHPDEGLAKLFTSASLGGWIIRRLLPIVVLAPVAIGYAQIQGEKFGYFDSTYRIAIMMVFLVLVLGVVLWRSAASLNKIDTARRRAWEIVHENEQSYRNQFAKNSVVMLMVDPADASIVDANAAALHFYGYSKDEILSLKVWDINTLSQEKVREMMVAIRQGEGKKFEFEHKLADGSRRLVEVSSTSIMFGERELLHSIINDITDRKRAEEALRESEKKYRLLTENAIASVAAHEMIFDKNGKPVDYIFLNVNQAFEKQTGLKVQDVIGKRVTEVLPGIEKSPFIEIYGEIIKTGVAKCFEQYAPELNKHYDICAYSLGGNQFATVFSDITDRVQAQETLFEREQFLQLLIETIPAPVFYKDREGRYLGVNAAFENFFAAKKEDLIGKSVFDTHPAELAKIYHSADQELFEQKGTQTYSSLLKDKKGELHNVVFHKASYTNKAGEVSGLIGVILDVTELKKIQETLKERESFLSLLIETIPTPVFYKDRQGVFKLVNKAFETVMWKNRSEILGKTVNDILDSNAAKLANEEEASLVEKPGTAAFYSHIVDGLGTTHDVIVQKSAVVDADGEVTGFIGALLDITDLKRAEEEIKESQSSRGKKASGKTSKSKAQEQEDDVQ